MIETIFENHNQVINLSINDAAFWVYHSDSYYELNNSAGLKYAGAETLFEYSFVIGLNFKLSDSYSLILDGKISNIPEEGLFYFPINLGFQIPF